MAAAKPKIRRFELWTIAILGLTWLVIGCNPATLNYLLMPFSDDRVPPECKLASKDKEVQVAIMTTFAYLQTQPELLPVEMELSEKLAQTLRERCKDNKEKIKIIPAAKVKSAVNAAGQAVSPHEIGKQLKADYVISLEINNMTLYQRGSSQTLYRGNTEINVNVFEIAKPNGEARIWGPKIYSCEYPGSRGPISATDSSCQAFRAIFMNKIARDMSRYFSSSAPDEDRRMND
ncbi:MAG: hypothetical protein HY040_08530 [Planctomycetes bacterium]|nr:hypothetical protein [Planctomycetota bacterium]